MAKQVERILVIRLKYLGDVIMTTPILRSLSDHYPGARISVLTREAYASTFEGLPYLNEIIGLSEFDRPFDVLKRLRECKFDTVIDLSASWRTALLCRFLGASRRIGLKRGVWALVYNPGGVKKAAASDSIDLHLSLLRTLGMEPRRFPAELHLTREEMEWATYYLLSGGIVPGRPLVAVHPGSRFENRLWPFDRYVTLVEKLHKLGTQVMFIQGGPDEGPMLQRMMDQVPNEVICADNLPLRRLASLLARADIFVSNYSGLMHLGAAVGTRVIGLFGPDDPDFLFPYSRDDGHLAIFADAECRPCQKDYCPLGTLECLQRIDLSTVLSAVEQRLTTSARKFSE